MITDELRQDLVRLPWRGPIVPISGDAPDHMLPQKRRYKRVRVFNMEKEEDRKEYERILCRIDAGVAEHHVSEIIKTSDGIFKILMVWSELYMCDPKYIPEESRPVLETSEERKAHINDEGIDIDLDNSDRMHRALQEWANRQTQKTEAAEAKLEETPFRAVEKLIYSEEPSS